MRCPLLNPIRFYASLADYDNSFPHFDNTTQRELWVPGLNPAKWYKEWLHGKEIKLQFEVEESDVTSLRVYKYNQTSEVYDLDTTLSPTNITPTGWQGNQVVKYSFTPTEGIYYMQFNELYGLVSDKFVVTNNSLLKKRMVEIVYSNTINDYGCIFENAFEFRQYLCGQLLIGNPQNEISAFQSDRGNTVKLQATPLRIVNLNITELHHTYADHVNALSGCDTITINGIRYDNTEPPSMEAVDGSDLVDMSIKFSRVGYFYD